MKNAHLALFARQGTTRHFVASWGVSMRHFNAMLVIALFALLFVSICTAQQTSTMAVPNLIRYSRTLEDGLGVASLPFFNGRSYLRYLQAADGAAVWQETQNVSLNKDGQYSVLLETPRPVDYRRSLLRAGGAMAWVQVRAKQRRRAYC